MLNRTVQKVAKVSAVAANRLRTPQRSLRFVIVGTGRCGTGYTSKALSAAGVPVGHETCYRPDGPRYDSSLVGDASWLAVPFLSEIRGAVYHQVRDPLAVVDSLTDLGLFRSPFHDPEHLSYRRFLEQHFELIGEELVDVVRFTVQWNLTCEKYAAMRFRVEDQTSELVAALEVSFPERSKALRDSFVDTETSVNSRERRSVARSRSEGLTYDDIPSGPDRDELMLMAQRYGYLD